MGKVRTTIEENKSKGKKIKVLCSKCARKTNHMVLQSVDTTGSEVVGYFEGAEDTTDWSNKYQIIQCQGCDTISFRHVNWFSEDVGPYDDGTTESIYPERSERSLSVKRFRNVPATLSSIYRETVECFNYEINTLCAAGLRAIVEGICADQGIPDGPVEVPMKGGSTKIVRKNNLQGKIAGLYEKGILTEPHSKILHEHRYLGNEAIHDLNQPSSDELKLAIEIIEHTLKTLYEISEKGEELRHKKAERKK